MKTADVRGDFPILARRIGEKPLVYLDNAATSQKPRSVIEAVTNYYSNHNANVHRGIHTLGDESTRLYGQAREVVARFIGATNPEELVFVRNTTEGINLVMRSWGEANVGSGDVIVTSEMEHHSNVVPWQMLAERVGARVEYVRVTETGEIDMEDYMDKMKLAPKLVAVVHVSNFLGAINPVAEMARIAHQAGAKILVDAAQSVPHMQLDVSGMDLDFVAFSGHKMLGPMGIGGLWVRGEILKEMAPFLYGGGMIDEVSWVGTKFAGLPDRFDAGTPNVAGAVGLMAAVEYLSNLGMKNVLEHEQKLVAYALEKLQTIKGIRLFGPTDPTKKGGVVAFVIDGVHAHDVAQLLDRQVGVAVRSGHHCVMPLHVKYKVAATTRASFYVYNDESDVDTLLEGLQLVVTMLG